MWDDFNIGNTKKFGAATCVNGWNWISENETEYWIDNLFANGRFGGRIAKNTSQGKIISQMIAKNKSESRVHLAVARMAIKATKATTLLRIIKDTNNSSYLMGKRDKAAEIRSCLDVH